MRHSIGCAATVALALALHVQAGAAEPWLEQQTLFWAGQRSYATYRIPALVVTTRGTVLAPVQSRVAHRRQGLGEGQRQVANLAWDL